MADYICSKLYLQWVKTHGINGKEALTEDWEELNKEIYLNTTFTVPLQLEVHLESSQMSSVVLFCICGQCLKTIGYFSRRAPLWMFHMILNKTLPNNILQHCRTSGLTLPPPPNLLIYNKQKIKKMKSWTDPASSFPWVTPQTKIWTRATSVQIPH